MWFGGYVAILCWKNNTFTKNLIWLGFFLHGHVICSLMWNMTPKEKQCPPHSLLINTNCLLPGSQHWGGNRAHLKSWPPAALFLQPGCELCHPAAHQLPATNPTAAAAHHTGSLIKVRMIMSVKAKTDTLNYRLRVARSLLQCLHFGPTLVFSRTCSAETPNDGLRD